ncbi:MAG: MIP/aquaporin family protein [Pseudomonadota bacterium]
MQTLRELSAEFLGTLFLLTTIVGSGIMGDALSSGAVGLALLPHAIAIGCMLFVLITLFGPVSGAHFNPAVTLVFALRGDLAAAKAIGFICAQIAGAICGTLLAHLMFDLHLLQISEKLRSSTGQWVAEGVATFGLLLVILAGLRVKPQAIPAMVGLYITAALWFTASTSFANPAVTVARALTETFTGIRPQDVLPFIAAQTAGAVLALLVVPLIWGRDRASERRDP